MGCIILIHATYQGCTARVNTTTILRKTTYWTKPKLVGQAIHQQYQKLKTAMRFVARDRTVRTLPVNRDIHSNPKMALQIFLDFLG